MKTFKPFVLLVVLSAFFCGAMRAQARVSFDFFYDNLQPYGEWIDVPDYGYCWHPNGVDEDWAPYTDGYWAYTDEGWTWVSYEDFGGITYHYGRWMRLEDIGWCWVPDYEWAPAWVSWRSSDDYIGWAPLPPRARFRPDYGFNDSVDAEYDIGPAYYSFCEYRNFGAPSLRPVIITRSRNVTIIDNSVNITNITINHTTNAIYVGGPRFRTVEQRSARPVQVLHLRRETDPAALQSAGTRTLARQSGNQLVVLAPEVTPASPNTKLPKPARSISAPHVDHGWMGVKDPALKTQLQTKIKQQASGHENTPARAVAPEDLKAVDQRIQASSAAATSVPTNAQSGKHGRNDRGVTTTSPNVASPESMAPANTTNVRQGNHQQEKVPADVSSQQTISQPHLKEKVRAAPETQPFNAAPTQTVIPRDIQPKHEKFPANVSSQQAIPATPTEPHSREKLRTAPETQPFNAAPTQTAIPRDIQPKHENVQQTLTAPEQPNYQGHAERNAQRQVTIPNNGRERRIEPVEAPSKSVEHIREPQNQPAIAPRQGAVSGRNESRNPTGDGKKKDEQPGQ